MKKIYCISTPVNGRVKPVFFGSRKNAMRYASGLFSYHYEEFPLEGDLAASLEKSAS